MTVGSCICILMETNSFPSYSFYVTSSVTSCFPECGNPAKQDDVVHSVPSLKLGRLSWDVCLSHRATGETGEILQLFAPIRCSVPLYSSACRVCK